MLSKRFALFAGIGALAGTASVTANSYEVQITNNYIKTAHGEQVYFKGTSTNTDDCTDQCLLNWPPVESTGKMIEDDSRFTAVEISGGTMQLLYNGRPLYTCNSNYISDCGTSSDSWPFATTSDSSSSGCSGLPVVEWAVEITDSTVARAELCDGSDHHVLCSTESIVAKFDAGTTTLSYDDSNNWQVKSGDTVVLTANGYKNSYALTTTVADTQLVDLVALNDGLSTPVADVTNCDSTFQAAVEAYTALQVPCEEVGNARKDLPGACATGTDACVVGYEYSNDDEKCKVKLAYVEPTTGDAATQAQHKRDHFKSIRKGGVVQRDSETESEFDKRKFSQMKINTREYFKQKMLQKISQNTDPNKKKHQMRKEERMPVSVAANSDDFKPAFIETLRTKFGLGSGQDRDVGIIVGPDNSGDPEDCANWALADTFDDADKCITYDAAIDGDTTDVHVLGADGAYNVGGILVGDKYVPVVKQTLANANAETYEMSCWSGSAWEQQHKVEMGANIYVKFTAVDDGDFYNFYTDSSCTTGQIVKRDDNKYHLKPQEYTFHRCAGDSDHAFDADLVTNEDGEFTGIAVGQTETLVVTSGDDFVWQCATHPNSMNGIFTGAGWEAGDEVPCTVSRSSTVVKVDTVVGSSVTGQVDNKCGVGYGCAYNSEVDPRVCLTGADFTCEECQIPEANGNVAAAPCLAQKCVAGEGAFISSSTGVTDLAQTRDGVVFDDDQDPNDCGKVADANGDKCGANAQDAVDGNPNCVPCPPGFYSESNNGYCYPVMEQTLQDTHIEIGAVLVKSSEYRFQSSYGVPQWYKITGENANKFEIKYCPGLECYGEGETGWAHDVWPDNEWGLATTGNPFLASSNCDVSESSTFDATLTAEEIKTKYEAAQALFLSGSPLVGSHRSYHDILVTNAEEAQNTQKQINNCYEQMPYPKQLLFPDDEVNWDDYKIFEEVSSNADYPRFISLPPDASASVYATVSRSSDSDTASYRVYAKYENGESATEEHSFTSEGQKWLSWLPNSFNKAGITSLEIQFSKEAVAEVKFSDLTLRLGSGAANPDWWRFCEQSREEEIKDGYPSCAECEDGKYAANNLFACASNTACGTQYDETPRLTGASRTLAGTCEECDVGYYAADGQTNCEIINTECGKQSDGTTSRLTGASSTSAGTCEECDVGYYATDGQNDCESLTTCQEGTYTETAGTSESQTVCEICPDNTFHSGATSPADTSSCTPYSTSCTKAGDTRDPTHTDKITDAPCMDSTSPTFLSSSVSYAIDENSEAGQVVHTASATDSSNDILYSLRGTDASAFTIDQSSREVTLKASPNYETKPSYSFTVVATDAADNEATQTVTLSINNLDEVAPSIESGDTATSILETAVAGKLVYEANADDTADVSGGVTFSLGTDDASAFTIDQSSGKVTLDVSLSPGSYSFTVTATDAAGKSATQLVSLTVLPDADKDDIDDNNDPCVYTGCTVQQLTDAYALLTSEDACSGSRRTQTHANVYGCKTAGCDSEVNKIKTAFDSLHTVCSA